MFRVSFFVDDKKLADVLHGLMGLAAGQPEVVPVANAVKRNGKIEAASGSLEEQFAAYAKKTKLTKFKIPDLTEFTKLTGLAPTSRNYIAKQLLKVGAIKRHGTGPKTYYTVVT